MNRKLLILTFFSVVLLGGLHQIATYFYLYWDIVWFDTFMHFLGGFSVGLLFLWGWYVSGIFGQPRVPELKKVILYTIAFVMMVSVAWEIFEYVFDISNPTGGGYVLDTLRDLAADLLGAITASVVGTLKKLHD